MIINLIIENPALGIVLVLGIALAISIHEAAHAWSAQQLGDSTAAALGRTTLNPLAHLDLLGSLMLLLVGFGWGKPVPVNDDRLRGKYAPILVALAGPASNLVLALVLSLLFRIVTLPTIRDVTTIFILINLGLMVFNLIPIPPLDGSKLLRLFIPRETYFMLEQYGFVIIIALFLIVRIGSFGFSDVLSQIVTGLFKLLTGSGIALF